MKLYIAVHKETDEPYRPPHTRYTKTHGGTVRAYTTPGRARAALGRRTKDYDVLEVDLEHCVEV